MIKTDLERLLLEFSQVSSIIKYLCLQKRFSATELKDRSGIALSTLYRYLKDWRDKGFLKKRKSKEYQITKIGLVFFMGFLNKASKALEPVNSKYFEEV